MKPSISIDEIIEFDADSLWEAVCRHFQASDMQIVDVELREKPLDDLYQVVLTYPDGGVWSGWMPNSELYSIYDIYLGRIAFMEEMGCTLTHY